MNGIIRHDEEQQGIIVTWVERGCTTPTYTGVFVTFFNEGTH